MQHLYETTDETTFQRRLTDLAESEGWLVSHTGKGRKYLTHAAKGFPDLVLVKPPTLLFLELKDRTGKPGPEQTKWVSRIQRCTQVQAFFADQDDAEHVVSLLTS